MTLSWRGSPGLRQSGSYYFMPSHFVGKQKIASVQESSERFELSFEYTTPMLLRNQ
jgi:hypothetical protein